MVIGMFAGTLIYLYTLFSF